MRKINFIMKLFGLTAFMFTLLFYQSVALDRAEALAINQAAVNEAMAYNEEILKANMEITGEEPEPGPYTDGEYTGTGSGYGGLIEVKVTVDNGYIDSIEVIEHSGEDPAYYMLASQVVDKIINIQGVDVDTVSGATLSSTGIIDAVSRALEQAVE